MAASRKSGPLTHLDDALDKIYEAHAGLGGDLNFVNTVFSYLRRKTQFFENPRSAKQVGAMAQKHRERAVRDSQQAQKRQKVAQPAPAAPVVSAVPKPSAATIEEVEDEDEKQAADTAGGEEQVEEAGPVGNGGTTDRYTWTQTLKEVVVVVPVPKGTRGRDLKVDLHQRTLKISWKRPAAGQVPVLVDGELWKQIDVDASTWTLEDDRNLGRVINLYLLKIDRMNWWDCVIKGDPKIDVTKIVPENSKLNDLDPSTRSTVEKMMFDQRAKAAGQPTSDERNRLAMLENFKRQHPEMDFSNAKFMT